MRGIKKIIIGVATVLLLNLMYLLFMWQHIVCQRRDS